MPLLELCKISKRFPGTLALDEVELSIQAGEIVALVGENGAGKSTLMKILSGVWPTGTYEGTLHIQNKLCQFKDTRDAHAAGVAMIHQELSVFPELTIAEHLELDRLPKWIYWGKLFKRTQNFLDTLNLGLQSNCRVGDLSVGGRQLVEIASALYRNARILVFDEPTSALSEQEVLQLNKIMLRLRNEGRGIIYISHRMDEIFQLANRIVVLRDGKNVGESPLYNLGNLREKIPRENIEPKLIRWMVGRAIEDIYPKKNLPRTTELLRIENLTLQSPKGKTLIKNLCFTLHAGEILGLAGLLGAGRSETMEALFGALNPAGPQGYGFHVLGNVWIKKERRKLNSPYEAIQARMAFVSEDRKKTGLILNQSIRKNISLPTLVAGRGELSMGHSAFSPIYETKEKMNTKEFSETFRVRSTSLEQPVGELSGGNQQKVVLSKWLLTQPEILLLDEPTRGIDIGSKVEIYQWIQKLASEGIGILLASSEMPELLGLCHRLLVLKEGELSAELNPNHASQEDIMRAASL